MDKICSYYIMGGAFLFPGNVTPVSGQIFMESIAANIVMKYIKNATIYPLNVTQQALITPEMVDIINKRRNRAGKAY